MKSVENVDEIWDLLFGSDPDPQDTLRWRSQSFSFSSEIGFWPLYKPSLSEI
jgi:hypothetical protein